VAGYRLELDPTALGWPVAALVRVRPTGGQLSKIIELTEALPQVSERHRITGEHCLLLKVQAATMTDLEDFLDRFLGTARP
jgi:Lrp/AsnC family leucine-responsive transcriptional regulator